MQEVLKTFYPLYFAVGSVTPASSHLNDSFLEDMQLTSYNSKNNLSVKDAERNVTRRTLSPATVSFATVIEEQDRLLEQRASRNSSSSKTAPTSAMRKSSRKEEGSDTQVAATNKEFKAKIRESKSRSMDNRIESKHSESGAAKLKPDRQPLVKDRARRSGSYKETDHSSEILKENKQPLNSSSQSNSRVEGKKESREAPEYVALLNAVKEVVSTYTKEEGSKLLRAMNQLHILNQASLIKNLMFQTDEIKKDLQVGEHSGQLKGLMEENEVLKENYTLLKIKYQDLQMRLEGYEKMREENADLKLKLQEYTRRT